MVYTKEDVEELLDKQRSLCYRFAKIEKITGYGDKRRISKDSIMNAVLEL